MALQAAGAAAKAGPHWPPSRALLSLIRREGPLRIDQLYRVAQAKLAADTFRSKTHYKACLKALKAQNRVRTFRIDKVGRGSQVRQRRKRAC